MFTYDKKRLGVFVALALGLLVFEWIVDFIIKHTFSVTAPFVLTALTLVVKLLIDVLLLGYALHWQNIEKSYWLAAFCVLELWALPNFVIFFNNAFVSILLAYATILVALIFGDVIFNTWKTRLRYQLLTLALVVITSLACRTVFFEGTYIPYVRYKIESFHLQ